MKRNLPHVENTLAHEIGHWIDHHGIKSAGAYSSHNSTGPLAGWRAAIEKSQALAELRAMPPSPYRTYQLNWQELWARSYAQFVAEKSGNFAMLEHFEKVRSGEMETDPDLITLLQALRAQIVEHLGLALAPAVEASEGVEAVTAATDVTDEQILAAITDLQAQAASVAELTEKVSTGGTELEAIRAQFQELCDREAESRRKQVEAEVEKVGDDVRALRAALIAAGVLG